MDKVENTKGKGVFVTVSSSPKIFCAGFDLKPWLKNYWNMEKILIDMQTVFLKIFTLNMPTLCIVNGAAIANGLYICQCHDKVVMIDNDQSFM